MDEPTVGLVGLLCAIGAIGGLIAQYAWDWWSEKRKVAETRLIVDKFQEWVTNYAQTDDRRG